jgi:hypothetical protein
MTELLKILPDYPACIESKLHLHDQHPCILPDFASARAHFITSAKLGHVIAYFCYVTTLRRGRTRPVATETRLVSRHYSDYPL